MWGDCGRLCLCCYNRGCVELTTWSFRSAKYVYIFKILVLPLFIIYLFCIILFLFLSFLLCRFLAFSVLALAPRSRSSRSLFPFIRFSRHSRSFFKKCIHHVTCCQTRGPSSYHKMDARTRGAYKHSVSDPYT